MLLCVLALLVVIFKYVDDSSLPVTGGLPHASRLAQALGLLFTTSILYFILSAKAGKELFIRRIPGLAAIDEAMGRATEMGRPIMYNYGIVGLGVIVLQSMTILSHVAKKAARFGSKVIVPAVDPQVMAVTEGVLHDAYASEGKEELFHHEDIRYLSGEQFAYAAGCIGIMHRERVAANFMLGYFYAEALLLAETGQHIGAIQIAGVPDMQQIPFFIVTCDYTIIGDEYYAGSAYLSREPNLLGSLVGQDLSKACLVALIAASALLVTLQDSSQWLRNAVSFIYRQLGG